MKIWDVEKRKEMVTCVEGPGRLDAVFFSPDGKFLAHSPQGVSWNNPTRARMWDTSTGKLVPWTAELKEACGLAFSPDGRTVALTEVDGTLKLCDAANGKVKLSLPRPPGRVYWRRLAFSPDGKRLAALNGLDNQDIGDGTADADVRVWDTTTGKQLEGPGDGATLWALSGDGATAVFSGRGEPNRRPRALRVHDWRAGKDRCAVDLPPGLHFLSADLTPDGRTLVTTVNVPGGWRVRAWDVSKATPAKIAFETEASVNGFALSKDGKTLATTEAVPPCNLWRGEGWKERTPLALPTPSFATYPPAISADGKRVGVFTPKAYFLCDANTGKLLAKPHLPLGAPHALSHDGKRLAAVSGGLVVWDVENNQQVLQDPLWGVNTLIFAADGSLYVGTGGHVVRYSLAGKVEQEWPMPARVVHLALSHSDRYLWCGLANGTTYVLDLKRR